MPIRGELRAYLAASPANKAVITDYAAMEAHKGDTLNSIYKSMEILCEFSRQVVILKSTLARPIPDAANQGGAYRGV